MDIASIWLRIAKRRSAAATWSIDWRRRYPGQVTSDSTPILQWGRYRRLSSALRIGLDYLRYSDPRYEATPKIRERAYERTPLLVLALAKLPFRGLLTRVLALLEQAVPRQIGVDEFIAGSRPTCC